MLSKLITAYQCVSITITTISTHVRARLTALYALTFITGKACVTVIGDITARDTDEVDRVTILSLVTILSGHTCLLCAYTANFIADEVTRTLIGTTAFTTAEVF
jgi:hypothetical protein